MHNNTTRETRGYWPLVLPHSLADVFILYCIRDLLCVFLSSLFCWRTSIRTEQLCQKGSYAKLEVFHFWFILWYRYQERGEQDLTPVPKSLCYIEPPSWTGANAWTRTSKLSSRWVWRISMGKKTEGRRRLGYSLKREKSAEGFLSTGSFNGLHENADRWLLKESWRGCTAQCMAAAFSRRRSCGRMQRGRIHKDTSPFE